MNRRILMIVAGSVLLIVAAFLVFRIIATASGSRQKPSALSLDTGSAGMLYNKAKELESQGEPVKAREACLKIMEKFPNFGDIQKVQETLDNLNIKILFSPILTKDSFLYEVQKGDTLTEIARQYDTTADLLARANGIKDGAIKIGQKLKVSNAKFSIVVDKSQNILTLKSDKDIVKTYRVATGKNNSTPAGVFSINNKLKDPPWYPPTGGVIPAGDPGNVLGTRWLGLTKPSYGIHGTTDPSSIGKSVTEGCVRMENPEVEELYIIVPKGTEVVIVD